MHICHVITRLIIGGAQENTLLTCRGLVDRGHRVTLVAGPETGSEGSLWERARDTGCELVTVPTMLRKVCPLNDPRAYYALSRLFRSLKPDVVHTHSSKAGILGRFAAARAGVPIIVHTIHGMSFNRTQAWPRRAAYRWLERRGARVSSAIVSVADAMTDQAVVAGMAPRGRFVTIYSGIETDHFAPCATTRERYRREWSIQPEDIVVGTIARLFSNKGYDDVIEIIPRAVARCPRLRFIWVGGGACHDRYEQRLERLGVRDRVHFVGLIAPEEVASVLTAFDILLHASRWEGLPRAVVQGLLTEVPPVCYDIDGAPEVVRPGETGITVPLGDTEKLADAIVTLAADSTLRERFGRRGRSLCLERFDWRLMVEQIAELYHTVQSRTDTVTAN